LRIKEIAAQRNFCSAILLLKEARYSGKANRLPTQTVEAETAGLSRVHASWLSLGRSLQGRLASPAELVPQPVSTGFPNGDHAENRAENNDHAEAASRILSPVRSTPSVTI
jgi:hypothetical protein